MRLSRPLQQRLVRFIGSSESLKGVLDEMSAKCCFLSPPSPPTTLHDWLPGSKTILDHLKPTSLHRRSLKSSFPMGVLLTSLVGDIVGSANKLAASPSSSSPSSKLIHVSPTYPRSGFGVSTAVRASCRLLAPSALVCRVELDKLLMSSKYTQPCRVHDGMYSNGDVLEYLITAFVRDNWDRLNSSQTTFDQGDYRGRAVLDCVKAALTKSRPDRKGNRRSADDDDDDGDGDGDDEVGNDGKNEKKPDKARLWESIVSLVHSSGGFVFLESMDVLPALRTDYHLEEYCDGEKPVPPKLLSWLACLMDESGTLPCLKGAHTTITTGSGSPRKLNAPHRASYNGWVKSQGGEIMYCCELDSHDCLSLLSTARHFNMGPFGGAAEDESSSLDSEADGESKPPSTASRWQQTKSNENDTPKYLAVLLKDGGELTLQDDVDEQIKISQSITGAKFDLLNKYVAGGFY